MKNVHPMAWAIIVGTLFARLATSMSMPFLGIYLAVVKGESPFIVGLILAASSLMSVLGGFVGGNLSDQYGRKKIMLGSVFIWAIIFFGFSLAEETYQFLLLSMANGLCKSFFEPPSRALISEVTRPENKLFLFNLRYTAANIGVAIGPLVGFWLGKGNSLHTFAIAGVVYVIYGFVLVILFNKTTIPETISSKGTTIREAFSVVRNDKVFTLFILAFILTSFGYSQLFGTLPQFFGASKSINNGAELFATLLTLNAVSVVALQFPILRIAKNYHPIYSTMFGTIVLAVGLIGFGVIENVWLLYGVMIFFTIGEILMTTMSDYYVDTIAPNDLRGTYFGAMAFSGIGSIIGPIIGGGLLAYFGWNGGLYIFMILGLITVSGLPLYIKGSLLTKNKKKQIELSQ